MNFKSVNEVLDFAVKAEEGAYEFYTGLAEKMKNKTMSKVFLEFAEEELGHKKKLLDIKSGKKLVPAEEKIMDLKIADYIVDDAHVENRNDLDYQDALILAMKEEKKAFMMYNALAGKTDNEEIKKILLAIAQEEAKHKLRFEIEYDELVLTEN